MFNGQARRVQRLTAEIDRPQSLRTKRIAPLADEGMAPQPCLDPDLIALPGDEPDLNQGCLREGLDDAVLAGRFLPARISSVGLFLDQRSIVPDQMIAPGTGCRFRMSVDDRLVDAFRFVPEELLLQRRLRGGMPGEDDDPGGVAIDAMDRERTARPV